MADVTDLFEGQKINKLMVGTIAAHVNNLIQNDEDYNALFQSDPIGCLMQFGLNQETSTLLIAEAKLNKELTFYNVKTAVKTCPEATTTPVCIQLETRLNSCESRSINCIEPARTKLTPCLDTKSVDCLKPITTVPRCVEPASRICLTDCYTTRLITKKCPTWDFLDIFPKIDDVKAWSNLALGK